jgi:hypothetical protein
VIIGAMPSRWVSRIVPGSGDCGPLAQRPRYRFSLEPDQVYEAAPSSTSRSRKSGTSTIESSRSASSVRVAGKVAPRPSRPGPKKGVRRDVIERSAACQAEGEHEQQEPDFQRAIPSNSMIAPRRPRALADLDAQVSIDASAGAWDAGWAGLLRPRGGRPDRSSQAHSELCGRYFDCLPGCCGRVPRKRLGRTGGKAHLVQRPRLPGGDRGRPGWQRLVH